MPNVFATLMLNWFANPYHAPVLIAKYLGYYKDVGIDLAILQPTDPSDVTKIVASGSVDIGLKAMIHTIAGRTRGYEITSVGTLLDEPITGLISLEKAGIRNFSDIVGKRLGYIGEFGKQIIDDLAHHAGVKEDQYDTVRVGMHMVHAIQSNIIDAGIGFSNFHQIELEAVSGPSSILRIDELAGLGCCCFCSIQIITRTNFLIEKREFIEAFLFATQRASTYITQYPEQAWNTLVESQPQFHSEVNKKIFIHTLPLFSRNLLNVERDWNKVYKYAQHLGLHSGDLALDDCYTNDLIPKQLYSATRPVLECRG